MTGEHQPGDLPTDRGPLVDQLAVLLCDGCDPGPCHDSISAAGRTLKFLANAGRLLPEGGETRTEWEVRWYSGPGDGIRLHEQHHASRESAMESGPKRLGRYGITRYSVHHREHRILDDGSSYSGPWVAVDQEDTDA